MFYCTFVFKFDRDLKEIRPEEFCSSYRPLVKQDYTDKEGVAEYTLRNATKEAKEQYYSLSGVMVRVNTIRDAMDEDEDLVLPINFSVVGVILLEFTNALSEYMVSLNTPDSGWLPNSTFISF